jgi:hypothetical protein
VLCDPQAKRTGLPTVRCQPVDRQPRRRVGMQSAQVQVDLLCLCDEGRYT